MPQDKNIKSPKWYEVATMFCDALENSGYGVLESIELWNTVYKPEIKAMPENSKRTWNIGKIEITLRKGKNKS